MLIPYCMFFLQYLFCIFLPWRCRIITQIVSKCHDRANFLPNLQKFIIIEKISTQYTIIPPHMFIIFWDFFHPIRLFHTIRLFFWSKCPPNTGIPYPTVIRYSRVGELLERLYFFLQAPHTQKWKNQLTRFQSPVAK